MLFRKAALVLALLFAASAAFAQTSSVERGKYLVEQIGKCGNCHTPLDADGKPDASKTLKGAVLNIQPIKPVGAWHPIAPDLTFDSSLWKRWGEEGLVKFLVEGVSPKGNSADAPMPTFKMHKEDAQAIVDYLKTLK
jgi:mono/diheme cytochrome c family protein